MGTNIKEESGLKFAFPENDTVIKFDDTKFYRDYFNKLPEAKGVDFISVDKNKIAFIEVKNCTGDEGNFGGHTRTKKMIMKELQDSMNKKLQWIDCRVSVVDSDTYNPEIFQVQS